MRSLLSVAAALSGLICSSLAAPALESRWGWEGKGQAREECTPRCVKTRVDFASMPPWERKEYTDSIKCLMNQPSQLDPVQYPAAINRYFDYAVIHVSRTQYVHLSGFFLTWHRYFLHLFEEDLRHLCHYKGRFPYWNFAATAGDIHNNPVFDGSEYSMSGDGQYVNTGPIALGPQLVIPHGTGGGCVYQGPFANLTTTLGFIDPLALTTGTVPPNAYALNESCLVRDLNQYVSQTYTNQAQVEAATHATDAAQLELLLNGIIGSSSLGIHSGAHFSIGGPMDSIHVSPQDPIWYPLHTFIDHIYDSWQKNNPSAAAELFGTGTALNIPPSANVTLDSIEPDWGYLQTDSIPVRDLLSTTAGPFCYQYDNVIS